MKRGGVKRRVRFDNTAAMNRWVEDTQMFQRIAGVDMTSTEELQADWKQMSRKHQIDDIQRIQTLRVIQDAATQAAKDRRS